MHAAHAAAHPDWAARQRARPPARARLNAGIPAPATAAAPPSRRRGARGGGRDVRRGGQPKGEKSGWKPPTRRGGRRERWMSAVWPAPNAAWRRSARRVCRGGRRSTWLHGIGLIPTARPIDRRSDITSCARWARPGRAPHPLPASQPKKDTVDWRPGGRRRHRHFPGSPSHCRQSAIRVVRAGTDAAIRAASPCESHRHHAWRVEGNPAIAAGREGAHIAAALKVPRRDRHVHSGEGRAPAHTSSPPPRPREPRHSPTRRLVTPRAHRRRPRHRRRRPFQEHDHGQVTRR